MPKFNLSYRAPGGKMRFELTNDQLTKIRTNISAQVDFDRQLRPALRKAFLDGLDEAVAECSTDIVDKLLTSKK
jgi:hypothetical protein